MIKKVGSPHKYLPKQKQVLDEIDSKKRKYFLYSGAYGAGKTLLMCDVVIRECIRHKNSLWLFGSQTIPMIRDTVVRTFLEEIDLYQDLLNEATVDLRLKKSYRTNTMSFKFWNGSEVLFRSCDEPSKFKSLNLDGFALDEPVDISEEVFLMLQGRLRANHTDNRFAILAGNPAGKTCWVYQKFFESGDPSYFVIHTTSYDNIYLPSDYISSMEKSYDYDYTKRYLLGEWGSFEGQVYKNFDVSKHVGDYRDKEYKYFIGGFDDGYRNPACMLTLGIDSDKNIFVVDEIFVKERTTAELVEMIYELDKKYNYHKIFCDPSAQNFIQLSKEKRLRVENANNDIASGISKLKMFFGNDIVRVDRCCKNLIKELESYRYSRDLNGKNLTEIPFKKDDHACYDKETEILTDKGWKLFKDLNKNETVATIDEHGILEYQKPIDYIEHDYDDYIYKYDGKIDFAVTNNHDMLVSSQYDAKKIKSFNLKKINIEDIYKGEIKSFWVPKRCGSETKNKKPYKIDSYTLGFYLAEGCKSISKNRKYVHFDNTNIDYINKIHKIYGGCISTTKRIKPWKDLVRLSIRSDFLYDNLPNGLCFEKRIPRDFLENASFYELFDCFIGMTDGDGSVSKRGQTTYNSTSEGLIDDFQELLIRIGENGTKYVIRKENKELNHRKCWRVLVYTDKSNFYQMFKNRIFKERYCGKVYCVTVPNGNVCVRRNGRIMFCGNCDALRYSITEFNPFRKSVLCSGGRW